MAPSKWNRRRTVKLPEVYRLNGSDNELTGKAHNVFPDGSETSYTLSQIVFSNNGKVIEGIWKADDIQSLHGTFRFSLDGENQFEGHYTVVNQEGEFYWNGTK